MTVILKCSVCRLSVRAFTQLFEEDGRDLTFSSPLFTDTFLSLPVVTEAGEHEASHTLAGFIHAGVFHAVRVRSRMTSEP